jgi:endonuclease/exonuclease/phosphatase family metal-dependent hydrolase
MRRRNFLTNTSLGTIGTLLSSSSAFSSAKQWFPEKKIITISYNVYQFKGYPETDDTKFILADAHDQMAERIALELALYKPHIITFQEAPSEEEVKKVADKLSMSYVYFDGGFPGAVLTKFDIVSSQNCPLISMTKPGDLFSRHWGTATLQSKEDEIKIFSIHMHPSNDEIRGREVAEVLNVMKKDLDNGKKVIFQGDFNHEPIQSEYRQWNGVGLIDCYTAKGVEQRSTIKSTFPNRTVDYVWINESLEERLLRCRVLFEGNFRTNPMDERSFALSDHLPVMAEFK